MTPTDDPYRPQSLRLLPCFPAQNGQKGQSSPSGKSSPSSWGAAHVPLAHGNRLDPVPVEELLDLTLDLRAGYHIGCHPTLKDRRGVRRLDHTGSDLGRGLVVGTVESHRADRVLRGLLWLAVQVTDRGRRSGLSGCDLLRKTTVLILPPAPTGTRIVTGDSVAIHGSPPTVRRIEGEPGGVNASADRSTS